MRVAWPWPENGRVDRTRRVATSYRRLLELALAGQIDDPAAALADLDNRWNELGQGWVTPSDQPLYLDDWLTPSELAELFHVDSQSFRHWARRGHISSIVSTDGVRRYRVGDVVEYARRRSGATTVRALSCQ